MSADKTKFIAERFASSLDMCCPSELQGSYSEGGIVEVQRIASKHHDFLSQDEAS